MALLDVRDLKIAFYDTTPPTEVVKGISFSLEEGETLGIVGESGSGKTQTALSILQLLKENSAVSGGEILYCCAALDPKENDTVLDLCAAPGGKTFTIAERMNNNGRVLAFDLHRNRAGLIESGAKRLGLDCIRAGVNNAKVYDEKMPKADKVLCDAPCSGLGVIRRKPEIKYKEPSDFDRLPEIQYDILKTSSEYVKVGGTLVYSTCTLSRAENDEVADRFLAEHPDFEPAPLGEAFGSDSGLCRMSITPAKYNSDGFFIAKFIRLR